MNPLLHVVVPVLAIAVMRAGLMAAIGFGASAFPSISPLRWQVNVARYFALGWLVLGIDVAARVRVAHPERAGPRDGPPRRWPGRAE